MRAKVEIDDTVSLQVATDRMEAALASLKGAGAPQALVEELIDAVQARAAYLVLARKAHRDSELYPYFPESYGPESDAYDDVAQLVATSARTPCAECGHPKGEHRSGECFLCGYLFSGSIRRKHAYKPSED